MQSNGGERKKWGVTLWFLLLLARLTVSGSCRLSGTMGQKKICYWSMSKYPGLLEGSPL